MKGYMYLDFNNCRWDEIRHCKKKYALTWHIEDFDVSTTSSSELHCIIELHAYYHDGSFGNDD